MANNRLKNYYLEDTNKLIKFLIPKGARTLIIENSTFRKRGKYDFVVINELIGDLEDVQEFFSRIKKVCGDDTRILVTYYNFLWRPIIKFATFMGWRKDTGEQNWLDNNDIANLLELAGLEIITSQKRLLVPIEIPVISQFVNRWIAPLPFINTFCLKTWTLAKLKQEGKRALSVSIIIPARNEEGNIPHIPRSIPKFGSRQELIFIEGHSKDNTWMEIQKLLKSKAHKNLSIKAFQQKGTGKADAVRLGFAKAKGDILIILDADLTVAPKELPKFYNVLASGGAEFANGSRLVYPMEKEAMNTLNIFGNRTFSWLFTWILGQRFKDTLCGTKALFRKDYINIVKNRSFFGNFDPFGDFDLIFGAIKQNLKIAEIPTRYKERVYGTTNIRRFKHGWLLLKMTWFAYRKFNSL